MDGGPRADIQGMSRTLGLPLLLVSLLIGGYLFTQQAKTSGPTAPAVTEAVQQANAVGDSMNFQSALPALQAWYAANGTYAGTELPPGSGVVLVRADATSYCMQTTDQPTTVMHESGPNGTPQPGPC